MGLLWLARAAGSWEISGPAAPRRRRRGTSGLRSRRGGAADALADVTEGDEAGRAELASSSSASASQLLLRGTAQPGGLLRRQALVAAIRRRSASVRTCPARARRSAALQRASAARTSATPSAPPGAQRRSCSPWPAALLRRLGLQSFASGGSVGPASASFGGGASGSDMSSPGASVRAVVDGTGCSGCSRRSGRGGRRERRRVSG